MSGRGVTLLMRAGYNYLGVCTGSLFATFSKVVYLQMLNGVFLFMYILYDDVFFVTAMHCKCSLLFKNC